MAITANDLALRYSTKVGAAGDTTASTAVESLGKYVSTTVIGTGAEVLFDNLSGAENAASTVDYRCIFVINNHATLTLTNAVVYIQYDIWGGTTMAIAVDDIAVSAKGAATVQAAEIVLDTDAPVGVGVFSSPTTAEEGLVLGNLAPGEVKAVWCKRSAYNSVAGSDGVTLAVTGTTNP